MLLGCFAFMKNFTDFEAILQMWEIIAKKSRV
jgi:hypothetical protein